MSTPPPTAPEAVQRPTAELAVAWPDYLASYEALEQHFRAQLEGLTNTEKGSRFATFVQRLVPQTERGSSYGVPELNPKRSDDRGVDLTAKRKDGTSLLHIQAKLWIDTADAIDSILSKFRDFLSTYHLGDGDQALLRFEEVPVSFQVVTLSSLNRILERYKGKQYASKEFFEALVREDRLNFTDGPEVFKLLRNSYLKLGEIPRELRVTLVTSPIPIGNVYLGAISSDELKRLYEEFGDALFFENIRDFLDTSKSTERSGRTTPNQEITRTVINEPEAMLARNNGIVFRADAISKIDSDVSLLLTRGSIVNGCQTTMCIVNSATRTCHVPVKFVETSNSWDIAKAANYQNSVADIDLELARHLRPQIVKRAANIAGIQILDGKESAFQIIDAIYNRRVAYAETRLFYLGLFSRQPNNLFAANYTEIVREVMSCLYEDDLYGSQIFETLFSLQNACQTALIEAHKVFTNPTYAAMFERFYKEDSPSYRCFVGILALCGAVGMNVAERLPDAAAETERMRRFLSEAGRILQESPERFSRYYLLAAKTWMGLMMDAGVDEGEIRQFMNLQSRSANFAQMYKKLCLEADLDQQLTKEHSS
jgi:hypothetical protein